MLSMNKDFDENVTDTFSAKKERKCLCVMLYVSQH